MKGPRRAEEGLQFRKREFDRIEVGTGGREESDLRPGLFNGRACADVFVNHQVVEHDDIARSQCGHGDLLDVRQKRCMVERAVEHRRRGEALDT